MHKRWMIILLLMAALAGCGRTPTPTPAPIPTAPSGQPSHRSTDTTVIASGEVVPARQAELSFTLSGRVHTLTVAEGDLVQSGDLLATLATVHLDADVAQAEAVLQAAQAQLALLQAGPRAAQVAAAQAQLEAAQAQLAQAAARRDQPDLGASQAEIAAAQSQVAAAQAARREADEYHDKTMTCVEVPLSDGQTRKICPVLGTIEEQARYALLAADAAQTATQTQLDALLAGAGAEVRAAQAGVSIATAQRDAAQAQLDLLQADPIPDQLAVARATVVQAQAALQAARTARDQATLRTPFPGTVAALQLSPGEPAMPGQTVLTLADLDHLQVETTDLSEQDVARVAPGQPVTVFVEGPGTEVAGRVARIASQATTVGGDVVYRVVVELDEQPAGLRWGMSVEVEIETATQAHTTTRPLSGGDAVVASGEIVPSQEAQLGFTVPGRVQGIPVSEGDPVQADQTLTTLETDRLEADVTQAEAAVAVAQADLALLQADPHPKEVIVAEARLQAAEGALAQAAARRDQLVAGATDAALAAARSQLTTAQAEEKVARDAYDQLRDQPVEAWVEDTAALRLRATQQARVAAEAELAQAESRANVQVREARAAIDAAAAQRDAAQAQLDLLQAESTQEELAAARAAVAQAQAALQAAQAARDQATLRAPFPGTVAALNVGPGETVLPGQAALALADLDHLRAQTTDLSERDVAQVAVGQPATVYVEALGVEIPGRVACIAAQATTIGGDVVYRVVVELDEQPPGLRWGMSAEVEITTSG